MQEKESVAAKVHQIHALTGLLSYKWYPAILYAVHELDGASYSEIASVLEDISSKMLSDSLSDLCERQLLTTTETVENSGKDIYILTRKGEGLITVFDVMQSWDQSHSESRASILIVEDERMIASILSRAVADSYDARVLQSGEAAIKEYTDTINIVILDRRLKEMSGDEVAARIKSQDETAIILSVSGIEPDNDIVQLEIDDYVHKPFTEEEIKNRVELLLKRMELDSTAREYLSLRSKQAALAERYGKSGKTIEGYKHCKTKIEKLRIPSEQQQTLDSLLYRKPNDASYSE